MDALQALKQVFIFKDVPEPVLQLLAGAAEERSVSAGETILSPGDVPNAMFVIRNGTVRLVVDARDTPFLFGSGETIGELPFLDGGPVAVTATALERADLLVIRSQKLAAILDARPEAGYQFYRAIAVSLAKRARRVAGMLAFAKEREGRS
jgi:CRP-like cAMP-binding protein